MRIMVWLGTLVQDIGYAIRGMRRAPVVTAAAILSLALGIGANTSIFALVNAVLLRSLPVRNPQELVQIGWTSKQWPKRFCESMNGRGVKMAGQNVRLPFSLDTYTQLRGRATTLSAVAGRSIVFDKAIVVAQGRADTAKADLVSGNFFDALGIQAAAGRLLADEDDRESAPPVVVLGHGYWTRRFGSDPNIVGRSVLINGATFTIAGVAAESFRGIENGASTDLYVPLHHQPLIATRDREKASMLARPELWWVEIVGRRKPGVSEAQARTEVETLFRQSLVKIGDQPVTPSDYPALIAGPAGRGQGGIRSQFSQPLMVLMTIVGFVLLIACANVANLLLARAVARRKEMAMRHALGATSGRLFRQMIAESILLSVAGGAIALLLTRWGSGVLLRLVSSETDPLVLDVGTDTTVLAFLFALSVVVGLLFGVVPAIQASRVDLNTLLKVTPADFSFRRFGLGRALVALQVAVSLALLIGAGLYIRTLWNLRHVALGFNAENVLTFRVAPERAGYIGDQLISRLFTELQNVPGARAVSYAHLGLLTGWVTSGPARVVGQSQNQNGSKNVLILYVGPKFFESMQIPVLAGRAPGESDAATAPRVGVVNEALVREYFGKTAPIGQRMSFFIDQYKSPIEIVGIVKDAKYASVSDPYEPTVYIPYAQHAGRSTELSFVIRTAGDPRAMASSVRELMLRVAPDVPIFGMTTQTARRDESIRDERLMANLAGCFAGLALFLAAIGLYGVISYSISRRTAEIGVRMALGANRGQVLRSVLRESLTLVGTGVVIGLAIAWGATRLIASQLYGLQPRDPASMLAAALLILTIAATASYFPARRASRIDPMSALRHE